MATLKLNGNTSGFVNITTNAAAANNTITLPDVTDTMATVTNPTFLNSISLAATTGNSPTLGLFSPSANVLAFSTSVSERMRIDSSGNVGVATATPTQTLDVNGNIRAAGTMVMASPFTMRNKIINGAMVIDQRNAGAAIASLGSGSTYTVDRFYYYGTQSAKFSSQRNQGSVTPPAGFSNYLGATSLSAYSVGSGDTFLIQQAIEGLNTADFAWGTASAKSVTLSFYVYSSLTGTFGGSLSNFGSTRCYPFSYTVAAANTWAYVTVTVAGDTTGSWQTNTNPGVYIRFGLGSGSTFSGTAGVWTGSNIVQPTGTVSVVGTNGATFYLTGVQLEIGSVATPFEYRNYQQELAMCQRYYYRQSPPDTFTIFGVGFNDSTTVANGLVQFPVAMRTSPAALEQSGTATHYRVQITGSTINCSAVPVFNSASTWASSVVFTVASGLTAGQASFLRSNNTAGYLGWSAEL